MKLSLNRWPHYLVAAFSVVILVVGGANLSQRKDYGFEAVDSSGQVIVSKVKADGPAETAGVMVGDRVVEVTGRKIENQTQMRWVLIKAEAEKSAPIIIERNGSRLELIAIPGRLYDVLFIIVALMVGISFFTVGQLIWWFGSEDPIAISFFRGFVGLGMQVVLSSWENFFRMPALHYGFSFLFIGGEALGISGVIEAFLRLGRVPHSLLKLTTRLWNAIAIVLFSILCFSYLKAFSVTSPVWTVKMEWWFNEVFSLFYVLTFLLGMFSIGLRFLRPGGKAELNRTRWFLITAFIGAMPFIFFYKIPMLFGKPPLIPMVLIMAIGIVTSIGWGMAVASFRMFKLEWVLSRTIVYFLTAIIVIIILFISSSIGLNYSTSHDLFSLIFLIIIGSVVAFLIMSGLIGQVRNLVDRMYYGDWFNYRKEMVKLNDALSKSQTETAIVAILTDKLPSVLNIEYAALFTKISEDSWQIPTQKRHFEDLQEITILTKISELLDNPPSKDDGGGDDLLEKLVEQIGYSYLLRLTYGDAIIGALFLGRKYSGAPFSEQDNLLLEMLSKYAGTALANLALTKRLLDNEKRAIAVDMAGGIAHEINNALSPLMGHAELLELSLSMDAPKEKLNKSVGVINEMCNRIRRIVKDLSRISEPVRIERQELSLNMVLEETLRILTETAGRIKKFKVDDPEAPFVIKKRLDPKLPIIIGDSQQLSQVFMNLIINASDAMDALGHGTLTVGTRYDAGRKVVIGSITDTGIGIPVEIRDKIFQPYFTTKAKGKGTGLGLAIIRSIIEAHEGRISVQSVEGAGTRFEFELPVKSPEEMKAIMRAQMEAMV